MVENIPNLVGDMMAYEEGTLAPTYVLDLFANLIATGTAWQLQGSYGRAAAQFIEHGYITEDGQVTDRGREAISMA
jgi:hypothetical protein